jgi:AraC family transcriptional regulator of adaptative response/methylated-DNA-[protein]-cysteine methyltransferase
MEKNTLSQQAKDYERIEKALVFLENNFYGQPTLDEIAASVQLSQFHFQRLFKRWLGITPTKFMKFLTL